MWWTQSQHNRQIDKQPSATRALQIKLRGITLKKYGDAFLTKVYQNTPHLTLNKCHYRIIHDKHREPQAYLAKITN